MIGVCTKCGAMFETTQEDACSPDCQCPDCYRSPFTAARPTPVEPPHTFRLIASCSWCHAMNERTTGEVVYCCECGHRADLPRSECDCPRCTATPAEREAARQLDMAELLRRFDAAGGELGKVLDGDGPEAPR